ncbi:zinc finger protein 492-like [Hetaerina americana]|uniref:zinc finger protein 492-like n=1 Tax=Hetaerina americana TaxID=62018 RepID=UPI003A7F180C
MLDKPEYEVCRLCLSSRGVLINVFGENRKLQIMLEKTMEDLIGVKVVKDAKYPWLVCSTCMEKLTEFRLFKRRCAECLSDFYFRIQKGIKPATEDWITNREEEESDVLSHDNKGAQSHGENFVEGTLSKGWVLSSAMEAVNPSDQTEMLQREDTNTAGNWLNFTSDNNCNELAIKDHGQVDELCLSSNKDVVIKEEWVVNIPQEEGCLVRAASQEQDGGKKQDGVENIFHKCQICNEGFAQKEILNVHVNLLHPVKLKKIRTDLDADAIKCTKEDEADVMPYKCATCLRSFSRKGKLKSHMLIHTDEMPYKCEICLKGFHEKQLLECHMFSHSGKIPYKCEICEKMFTLKQRLKDHIRVHAMKKPHKCEVCSKVFTLKQMLTEHKLTHSGQKLHRCEICSKAFFQKQRLRRHMLIHNDERPYKCEICFKGFNQKIHLKSHILNHTGEKPYKCQLCLKTYALKQSLKVHMYIHTVEKPHKCEICSKSFTLKQQLTEHGLTHINEKRHKCEVCSKAFLQKSYLRRHMLIHTGQRLYKCYICLKNFNHKYHLKDHIRLHAGQKLYKCEICSKAFSHKPHLKRHMLTHTGERP